MLRDELDQLAAFRHEDLAAEDMASDDGEDTETEEEDDDDDEDEDEWLEDPAAVAEAKSREGVAAQTTVFPLRPASDDAIPDPSQLTTSNPTIPTLTL